MKLYQWLRVFYRLRRYKEKLKTASSAKKGLYLFSILFQIALGVGLGIGSYLLFNSSEDSGLVIFLIVIAAGSAISAAVWILYEIIKLCFLIASCFGDKSNKE